MPSHRARRIATSRVADRYELVLLALLVTYVVVGTQGDDRTGTAFHGALAATVVTLTLRASAVRARWVSWVVGAVVLVAIAVAVENAIRDSTPTLTYALVTATLMVLPVVVIRRIFEHTLQEVWGQTILATICVYLLLGLLFAYALLFLNAVGSHPAIRPPSARPSDYLYLSVTALTTVGFGDVVAGTSVARVLVTLEAVFGQVFLVVLVARLVAAWQPRRRRGSA